MWYTLYLMKVLVTHINPHLDDIAAIWLFKKFYPEFKDAEVEFLSAGKGAVTWENKPVDSDPNIVHFGIGRGKYDEHKGDLNDCATSLVWKDVKSQGKAPKEEIEKLALEELVHWVTLEDTGRLPIEENSAFSVPAFIRPKSDEKQDSQKAIDLGSEILDRILAVLEQKQQAIEDWEQRLEFETKFGKTVAVQSSAVDRSFCKSKQGDLFIMYEPNYKSVQYFTPSHTLDLEPIYKKAAELDPQADWFLHHSHHMVICGSGASPDSKKTKLSFDQLVELVKTV